jgi:hypothetical protein
MAGPHERTQPFPVLRGRDDRVRPRAAGFVAKSRRERHQILLETALDAGRDLRFDRDAKRSRDW